MPIRGEVDLENTLLTWLPIIFFGVVICLLLWTIRFMPRAKPAPVIKGSQVEVSWATWPGSTVRRRSSTRWSNSSATGTASSG